MPAGPPSSTEFSLGIPAQSQAEVDRLLVQVEAAGGTLTAPAHMRPFGVYSGYFTDPDGHLFEIAWNSNEQVSTGRRILRACFRGSHAAASIGATDPPSAWRTFAGSSGGRGLTCQPKIAAAGSVTLRMTGNAGAGAQPGGAVRASPPGSTTSR